MDKIGQLTSNLMRQFDYFGLDYREGWKLLMDEGRWREWKKAKWVCVDSEIAGKEELTKYTLERTEQENGCA